MSHDHGQINETKRDALLNLLLDLEWHDHFELQVAGVRYGARVLELKRLGYQIETRDLDYGKQYRLKSVRKGKPQEKRVKIFLPERDATALVNGHVTRAAMRIVKDALGSFQENKHKL